MTRLVVGMFDSLDAAATARRQLTEAGFDDVRIHIVGGDKLDTAPVMSENVAEEGEQVRARGGAAGVIERMLSGWLISDRISEYAQAASRGKNLLALDVPDDASAERATAILNDVRERTRRTPATGDRGGEPLEDLEDAVSRPQVYVLPNAPTGWGEATRGEPSAIDALADPGRPRGLIENAGGLGTDDTDGVFKARKAAARRGKRRSPK